MLLEAQKYFRSKKSQTKVTEQKDTSFTLSIFSHASYDFKINTSPPKRKILDIFGTVLITRALLFNVVLYYNKTLEYGSYQPRPKSDFNEILCGATFRGTSGAQK